MQDDVRASEHVVDGQSGPRLRVTSNRLPSEHLDGAWWPESTDLVAELPALLPALSDRLGQVVMVGYRRDGWDDTPPEADIADHTVELLGFDSAEPASVIVIGHDGHHLTLRVIAPETSDPVARQALQAIPERTGGGTAGDKGSAAARSVADVADTLAHHEGRDDDHAPLRSRAGVRKPLNNSKRHEFRRSLLSSSNTSLATGCCSPAARRRYRRQTPILVSRRPAAELRYVARDRRG